ncbi:MAG: L,D-transpeptidase [Leptolyngbyaceae cyanobacterium SL_7_1]|nr:L,D-transpeptidase [Leptolyngbyaceae cyanobacterium SL_7_1]
MVTAVGALGVALPFVLLSRQQVPATPIAPTGSADLSPSTPLDRSTLTTASAPFHLKVDLSDRTVTLYRGENPVREYPIAIGRLGWDTPIGNFQVAQKFRDPNWINPLTDEWVAADDPQNPLGGYWIGFWTDGRDWVGFHGTPDTNSVGTATSHGCIRMHTEHIQELFEVIDLNTPVEVAL